MKRTHISITGADFRRTSRGKTVPRNITNPIIQREAAAIIINVAISLLFIYMLLIQICRHQRKHFSLVTTLFFFLQKDDYLARSQALHQWSVPLSFAGHPAA